MLVEKLFKNGKTVFKVNFKKDSTPEERVLEVFKAKGFKVRRLFKEIPIEGQVEEFLQTTHGDYVYLLCFPENRYLTRGGVEIKPRKTPFEKFLARNDAGLKRLLLSILSRKKMLLYEAPIAAGWLLIGLGFIKMLGTNFLPSLIFYALGFALNEAADLIRYYTLGYFKVEP